MPRVAIKQIEYSMQDFSHWVDDSRREKKETLADVGAVLHITGQRMGQKIRKADFSFHEFLILCKRYGADADDMERFTKF